MNVTELAHAADRFTWAGRLGLACVVFCAGTLLYVLYRAFIPQTALTVNESPLPIVLQAQNGNGSRAIRYRLDYCKAIDAPSQVVRELRSVDGPTVVSLYTSGYSLAKGCHAVHIIEPMPSYVPEGRWVLRITFIYRVNAVTSPATFETEPFNLR